MGICDTLRELLENRELQDALGETFAMGIESPTDFDSIDLADHIRHARGIEVYKTPFEDLPNKLEEIFQSFVIGRLPEPQPITADDLRSHAVSHLAGIQRSDEHAWRDAYRRFISFAHSELDQLRHARGCFGLPGDWQFIADDEKSSPYAPDDGRVEFEI
jgi:hypothetical protein